jgi:itaconate CoA-transferase
MTGAALPLDGVLVVSIEQAVAAPLCTARLAADGARIIKVERLEGDFARDYDRAAQGQSSYFVWLNRGKQSIAMDLKQPSDLSLLKRMIKKADVFVQNLGPGATSRLGLDASALHTLNPGLITCDISGYGDDGPYRDMKAYDLLVQCEAGLASITGSSDAPGRVGVSIADIGCGLNAYAGILRALVQRSRTGLGSSLAISLFDTVADWMSVPYLHAKNGTPPARVGIAHPSIAPYGQFLTADGATLVIAVQNDREWRRLCASVLMCEALAEHADFATNTARVANRRALDAIVSNIFAATPAGTLTRRLKEADIAFGHLNTLETFVAHPQLRTLPVPEMESVLVIAPPLRIQGEAPFTGPVPSLDAHGALIRQEFSAA